MLKFESEFSVGINKIGFISERLSDTHGKQEFEERASPVFKHLPRIMTIGEVESEMNPGLCELGDILAFIKNAPEECKDGWANIFPMKEFVVLVDFCGGEWVLYAWARGDIRWDSDCRVFSPATVNFGNSGSSPSDTSGSLTLQKAIELVKKEGYEVFKRM